MDGRFGPYPNLPVFAITGIDHRFENNPISHALGRVGRDSILKMPLELVKVPIS